MIPPDTDPPSVPGGLVSQARTTTSITLSWNASSDNRAIAGYQVYRDDVQVGTPTSTSFTDTGLEPDTAHSYTVKAVDTAGLTSDPSSPLIASTSPIPVDMPPSQPQNARFVTRTSTTITIAWDASSDDHGVTRYNVIRDGSPVGTTVSLTFTDQNLPPASTHTYRVTAQDAAGHVSTESDQVQATTDQPPPATRPNVIVINTDDQRRDTVQYLPKIQQWLVNQGTTVPERLRVDAELLPVAGRPAERTLRPQQRPDTSRRIRASTWT